MLQHRGQDAAGIARALKTGLPGKGKWPADGGVCASNMARLLGDMGVGHVRYPTAGCSRWPRRSRFTSTRPMGSSSRKREPDERFGDRGQLFQTDMRHLNTTSDSEVMLNVLAHAMARSGAVKPKEFDIFASVEEVHRRCKGGYAVIAMVAGVGMVAFRDLYGIRPLVFGTRGEGKDAEYMIASESVALQMSGFDLDHDLAPGEVIFIDMAGTVHRHVSPQAHEKTPCIFEFVYLARPDSVVDGASVYQCRINMGTKLAEKIKREWAHLPIDVVIPIPSTSRVAAQEIATRLNLPYRDALVRNRYVGRTFIMPGQAQRKQSIRRKLNPIP